MAVLKRFSDKEADSHLYPARQNAIREEHTKRKLLEEALREKKEAVILDCPILNFFSLSSNFLISFSHASDQIRGGGHPHRDARIDHQVVSGCVAAFIAGKI